MLPASGARRPQLLLEPLVRVRLTVEIGHLAVAGAFVQSAGFDERAVRIEPQARDAAIARELFDALEQTSAEPHAAHIGRNPHALHFGVALAGALETHAT